MWAHQPFVNQLKQGFNLMLWPRLEPICRWCRDWAVRLALWELERWWVVVCRGGQRGTRSEEEFLWCSNTHTHAHTQHLTNRRITNMQQLYTRRVENKLWLSQEKLNTLINQAEGIMLLQINDPIDHYCPRKHNISNVSKIPIKWLYMTAKYSKPSVAVSLSIDRTLWLISWQ